MTYKVAIPLMPGWLPVVMTEWLEQGQVFDMTVRRRKIRGVRQVEVELEASTPEDLEAKRTAFNHMIEAAGYGPQANK